MAGKPGGGPEDQPDGPNAGTPGAGGTTAGGGTVEPCVPTSEESCAPICVPTDSDASADETGTEEEPAVSGHTVSCPSTKVLICHRPPGNPANEHTLCVGAPAVSAHLTHHPDSLGACAAGAGGPPVLSCDNDGCAASSSCAP